MFRKGHSHLQDSIVLPRKSALIFGKSWKLDVSRSGLYDGGIQFLKSALVAREMYSLSLSCRKTISIPLEPLLEAVLKL